MVGVELRRPRNPSPATNQPDFVSFVNAGAPMSVRYDLVKTKAGWRIDNMRWAGTKESLRDILTKLR